MPWPGSPAGKSAVPIHQSWGFTIPRQGTHKNQPLTSWIGGQQIHVSLCSPFPSISKTNKLSKKIIRFPKVFLLWQLLSTNFFIKSFINSNQHNLPRRKKAYLFFRLFQKFLMHPAQFLSVSVPSNDLTFWNWNLKE